MPAVPGLSVTRSSLRRSRHPVHGSLGQLQRPDQCRECQRTQLAPRQNWRPWAGLSQPPLHLDLRCLFPALGCPKKRPSSGRVLCRPPFWRVQIDRAHPMGITFSLRQGRRFMGLLDERWLPTWNPGQEDHIQPLMLGLVHRIGSASTDASGVATLKMPRKFG